ncbi:MAG TPA: hypothetical protein VHR66_17545 [Gemmataceae bacterium]|jgi:hypothetical protein|nr:hypothetical protein [Gemmataceae bacterium]
MATTRRGIQSVYFLALQPSFVSDICMALLNAPAGTLVEIEFSAAHDGGRGWANARTAINTLQPRGLNMTVDFGHHTVAPDKTASEWGASLFSGLFKNNWNKAQFIIEVANEDTYSNADWATKMSAILGGLRTAWSNDSATKNSPFPYGRLAVRRCPPTGAPQRFKIAAGDSYDLPVETEYHFPADGAPNWAHPATVISNDGQIVYRRGIDPNPWAYNGSSALRQVSLADFKSKYGLRALLWHPALHRWNFSNGAYHATPKADASAGNQAAFLSLLKDFLK